MKITKEYLTNLVETLYEQVESDFGIPRNNFVEMAGLGARTANRLTKSCTLKTILKLIETRDKIRSEHRRNRAKKNS